jgi:hypothetical protein
MDPDISKNVRRSEFARAAIVLVLLAALVWIARFWHSTSFGMYEDDYTRIPGVFEMTPSELGGQISFAFRYLADNAKPLHSTFIFSLAFLGARLGGLSGIYVVGFAVVALNAVLFFLLSRRLFDELFAICAAFAFALFSADTTQAFITHALGLQTSLTFLLLAFHAYLSGRRNIAYLLAAMTLLTYEVPFPVLLAAPLLEGQWTRQKARELIKHGAILMGIFSLILLVRFAIGESRVTSLTFPALLTTPLLHMLQGPFVAIGTYFYRPIQALSELRSDVALAMIGSLPIFTFALYSARVDTRIDLRAMVVSLRNRGAAANLPTDLSRLLRIAGAGIGMLVLAYAFTFTVRAYAISGRDTRVHLAAALGAALVLGSLFRVGLGAVRSKRQRLAVAAAVGALFSGLLGFGFVVQADYAKSWQLQESFWSELLPRVADVQAGQVILVDPDGLIDTRHIDANTWNMPRVLKQIIEFPSEWDDPPRAFRLTPNWREHLIADDGSISLSAATVVSAPDLHRTVNAADVIFIETSVGLPHRLTRPLLINGQQILIDTQNEDGLLELHEGPLYPLIISANN